MTEPLLWSLLIIAAVWSALELITALARRIGRRVEQAKGAGPYRWPEAKRRER